MIEVLKQMYQLLLTEPHAPAVCDQLERIAREAIAELESQEPVAVVDVHEFYDNCANFSLLQKLPKGKHTLYTHPPQRTWVGLTDSQRKEIERQSVYVDGAIRMTEAKLKEKNCD
jgi:hypothetical protein